MSEDEMMQIIEQVVAQSDQQRTQSEREAYISKVASRVSLGAWNEIANSYDAIPEPTRSALIKWQKENRDRVSFQIGELVRLLLRKELLGE